MLFKGSGYCSIVLDHSFLSNFGKLKDLVLLTTCLYDRRFVSGDANETSEKGVYAKMNKKLSTE